MFYKPEKVVEMWDTWLYYYKGIHYLFYLHKSSGKNLPQDVFGFDGLSLATSVDGIHYREIGPIIKKSDDAQWLGTGSTWKAGSGYILNFSEARDGVQNIFFAKSKDLINWQRLGDEYSLSPNPKWYDDTKDGRWDCIWTIPKREGGFFGYLSARPWDCPPGDSVGMVESSDGINWDAVAPPKFEWGDWPENNLGEVGAIEKIGNYYYLLLNHFEYNTSNDIQGHKLNARSGIHVFISSSPKGPFRPQKKAYRFLTAPGGRPMGCFTRFYKTDKEMLINHHWIEHYPNQEVIWMAPLKKAIIDKNKCLRMGYWGGNEKAKGKEISIDLSLSERIYPSRVGKEAVTSHDSYVVEELHGGRVVLLKRSFDIQRGIILEGSMKIESVNKHSGGIGIFIEEEKEKLHGTAVMAQAGGKTEIGPLKVSFLHEYVYTSSFGPDDVIDGSIIAGKDNKFRLFLRRTMLEFYINDVLIQCYSLPGIPTGRIGLVFESCRVCFKDFKAWEMDVL